MMKAIRWITLLLLLPCLLLAKVADQQEAKIEELIHAAGSPRVIKEGDIPKEYLVEGITLVDAGTKIEGLERKHGIQIDLKGDYAQLSEILTTYLNHALSEEWLGEVKEAVTRYFREKKKLYVATIIPIQEVSNAVVIFQVLEGKVGKVRFTGQKWFSEKLLERIFGVKSGDPLNETAFLNNLSWLNKSPFHNSKMILVPSEAKGQADLLLITSDRLPFRFYTGTDNTGFLSNGQYRMFAGFNWGNVMKRGDMLSYQYTSSPNFHNLQSHVVNYNCYLPWKHTLTVFGCYGSVFPIASQTTGTNIQVSARYQVPILPLFGRYLNELTFGFDYKWFSSNFFFVGDSIQSDSPPGAPVITREAFTVSGNPIVAIAQFMTAYDFQRSWTDQALDFRVEMYLSPWKDLFPHQRTIDYQAMRPSSHVRYAYWKFDLENQLQISSGWTFRTEFRAQVATGTLPTSEQFGLGGADTVRGYYDQQFVADNALCLNAEAYTPQFNPTKNRFTSRLTFLAFVDYAYGYNYSATSPVYIKQNLLGMGPGVRYQAETNVTARLDYGFQVLGIPQDHRFGRFHFSVIASY